MHAKGNSPQISVVLTTYNRAKHLPRAIASILNQTLTDFEFIIVNDGSTDDTRKVLATYAKNDSRIKVIHQKNGGLGQAQNEGVRHANGDYIAFMDDDDRSLPTRLAEQLSFLRQRPNLAACVCYYQIVKVIGERIQKNGLTGPRHDGIAYGKELLKKIPLTSPLTSMMMITKEAFTTCGGYRPFFKINEDLDFTLRFQEKFRAAVMPKTVYEYTKPESNWGSNLTTIKPIQTIKYQLACYISAWCRRNKHQDPIDQDVDLDGVIHIGSQLPRSARFHILYRCLEYSIGVFLSNPDLSAADIIELFNVLRQLDDEGDLRFLYHRRKRLFTIFARREKYKDALRFIRYGLRRSILPN